MKGHMFVLYAGLLAELSAYAQSFTMRQVAMAGTAHVRPPANDVLQLPEFDPDVADASLHALRQ